jgi:biopolymer transport protein ExbD
MRLGSPLPQKKARIEIIPLIDIMFFLLASFMLVSLSMIRMKGVKMTLPQASSATTETNPDFIPIGVSPTGELFWDKDKTPISAAELTPKIAALFQADKDLRIFINADRDATHGTVIDVLDRVRQAGVTKVSFAIKPGAKAGGPDAVPAPPTAPVAPAAPPAAPAAPAAVAPVAPPVAPNP